MLKVGEAVPVQGGGEPPYPPVNFAVNLHLLQESQVYSHRHREGTDGHRRGEELRDRMDKVEGLRSTNW